jgi:putative ABC transport system substrate-binding protein
MAGCGDVASNGTVKNIARPEGNITGVANLFGSIGGKWLQLLKEAAPAVERVGLIYSTEVNAQNATGNNGYMPSIEEAGRVFAVQTVRIPYRNTLDIVRGIDAFAVEPKGGLIVMPPPPTAANGETVVLLAIQHRLPAIYQDRSQVAAGGLLSYGSDVNDLWRRVPFYVDRILRGAKVSELPVEYPTKFELVVNLETAKAIGLTIPEIFLVRADEVIEADR